MLPEEILENASVREESLPVAALRRGELRGIARPLEGDAEPVDRALVGLPPEPVDELREPPELLARERFERHRLDSVREPRGEPETGQEGLVVAARQRLQESIPRPRALRLQTVQDQSFRPIAGVAVPRFLVYFLPLPLVSSLMWFWSRFLFQPHGLLLSWRGVLLEIARWPVVLWALINVVFKVKRSYMITPKGVGRQHGSGPTLLSLYAPYFALTVIPLFALWYGLTSSGALRGYCGLALLNGAFAGAVLVTTLVIELRTRHLLQARLTMLAAVAFVVLLLVTTAGMSWHAVAQAIR